MPAIPADPKSPAGERPPRRLSRDARREQLVAAAMPIVAAQGLSEFPLDEVAAAAGVTRNLLYHYFPRGRPDLALAVAQRTGQELTGEWILDDELQLPERLAANFSRMLDHAMRPSDAWRIHRMARAAAEPELLAVVERFIEVVIANISLNHLGTPSPPPLVHIALRGYVAFAETVLDEARRTGTPRERVMQLLSETLVATIQAAVALTEAA
jgi:AcrR family transcriptional regulator